MPDKYRSKARKAAAAEHARRSCERKRAYSTIEAALLGIPSNQHPYHCTRCQSWHRSTDRADRLTLQIRRVRRRRI